MLCRIAPAGCLALSLVTAFTAGTVSAEPVALTAPQINQLLSRNTGRGTWDGAPYDQFFATDGATTYAPAHAPATEERWHVNPAENTYESWWEGSGWSTHAITRDDETHYWNAEGTDPQPLTVLDDNRLGR